MELLLAAIIISRSTSYLFSKLIMEHLEPYNLLAIRFSCAFIVLCVLFHNKLRSIQLHTLFRGFLLGIVFTGVMAAETHGLRLTDSGTTSFLENSAVIIVPIIEAIFYKELPQKKTVFSILITFCGIAFLTLSSGNNLIKGGSIYCILAAILYAAVIVMTAHFSKKDDALVLGILQVGFIGLFSLILSFIFETPALPQRSSEWAMILILALVCTCFGFTLQPLAQKHISAERAGMFCALSPFTATLLGAIILHEELHLGRLIGCVLVLIGILFPHIISCFSMHPYRTVIKSK